jgi:hypothetical protein
LRSILYSLANNMYQIVAFCSATTNLCDYNPSLG